MTDRPIIFSAAMVHALLDGRKTQTRRLASSPLAKCKAGDRLWVRETFTQWGERTLYAADGETHYDKCETPSGGYPASCRGRDCALCSDQSERIIWRPSIHMPRWASRLTLVVSDVRRQRLQDISCADVFADAGVLPPWLDALDCDTPNPVTEHWVPLWNSLHGHKPGEAWADNPEIVALTFQMVRGNIDQIVRAA